MKKQVYRILLFFFTVSLMITCNTKKELVLNDKEKSEWKNLYEKITGVSSEKLEILRVLDLNDYHQVSFMTNDGKVQLLYFLKHPEINQTKPFVLGFWLNTDRDLSISVHEKNVIIEPVEGLKYVAGNKENIRVFDLKNEMNKVLRKDKYTNPGNFRITSLEWHPYKQNPVLDVQFSDGKHHENYLIGYNLVSQKAVVVSCHGADCCKVRYYPEKGYYECGCEGCAMQAD